MFSIEFNGYNRREVDDYIEALKKESERAIMDEKLRALETEKKYLDMKRKNLDIENKEKKIVEMLDSFKKIQEEGNKNIETLQTEQLKMIYLQMSSFMKDLNSRYPGVLINPNYKKLVADIENIVDKTENKPSEVSVGTINDPMRLLLSKMQEKKVQSVPREVKIERTEKSISFERPSQIKPVCDMQLTAEDGYDNLVDKFLNTAPVETEKQPKIEIQSSGFDIKEAISPTENLDEIMKAFNFYNDEDNKAQKSDYHFDDDYDE